MGDWVIGTARKARGALGLIGFRRETIGIHPTKAGESLLLEWYVQYTTIYMRLTPKAVLFQSSGRRHLLAKSRSRLYIPQVIVAVLGTPGPGTPETAG